MALELRATNTALGPGLTSSFLGVGGTAPYTYAVLAGGAGGSVNSSTGVYTAPSALDPDPKKAYDTIQVTDAAAQTVTKRILVGNVLLLFCEILQRELGLADGRVYLWDQKIMQPTDSDLYIAVGVVNAKPFANTNKFTSVDSDNANSVQSVNMMSVLSIDLISRGPAARDRQAEVLMALNSNYAEYQQALNSFFVGKLPAGSQFVNISEIDGAAIPYRFRISINVQYFVKKSSPVEFFDQFVNPTVATES